jgi:hypothetical protein
MNDKSGPLTRQAKRKTPIDRYLAAWAKERGGWGTIAKEIEAHNPFIRAMMGKSSKSKGRKRPPMNAARPLRECLSKDN